MYLYIDLHCILLFNIFTFNFLSKGKLSRGKVQLNGVEGRHWGKRPTFPVNIPLAAYSYNIIGVETFYTILSLIHITFSNIEGRLWVLFVFDYDAYYHRATEVRYSMTKFSGHARSADEYQIRSNLTFSPSPSRNVLLRVD